MSQKYPLSRKPLRNNRKRSSSSDVILISDDEIRKERNRKASANYRKKKNDLIDALQEETKILKQKLNEMSREYENSRNKVEMILMQLKQNPAIFQMNNNFMQLLNGLFKIPKPIESEIKVQQSSSKAVAVDIDIDIEKRRELQNSSQQQPINFPNQRYYKYTTLTNDSKNNDIYNASINKNIINEQIYQKLPRIRPTTLSIITDLEQQPPQLTNVITPYNANHNIVTDSPGILFVSAFLKNYNN